jgi:hypothetical protein
MNGALHELAREIRLPYGDKSDSRSQARREMRASSKDAGKARAAADRARQRRTAKKGGNNEQHK